MHPGGRPPSDPDDGAGGSAAEAPGAPQHALANPSPNTPPRAARETRTSGGDRLAAGVTAYQVGAIDVQHRVVIADIVRSTGMFGEHEIAVALELFDATYGPPSGGADAGDSAEGSDYEFLGLFDTDGVLLGYACFGPTPGTDRGYDLYWIAVTPAVQGAGGGTFLIGEVERRLRGRNARLVLAETSSRPMYAPTRAFYVARGYTEGARVRDFYGVADDRVLFTKRLQPAPRVRGSRGGEAR